MTPEQQAALKQAAQKAAIQQAQQQIQPNSPEARALFPTPPGGVSTNSEGVAALADKGSTLLNSVHNGAFYGFGDTINGIRGAMGNMTTPDGNMSRDTSGATIGERYIRERDRYRDDLAELSEQNPAMAKIGNIAGMTASSLATAPFMTGKGLLGTAAMGGALGSAEGAIIGGGMADGENVGSEMLKGAGIGAGLGAVAPLAIGASGAGINMLRGMGNKAIGSASKGMARRTIADMLRKSGQSADDVTRSIASAARQGQPEFRLMDAAGKSGNRVANGIVRSGGDGAEEIAQFLRTRQLDQVDRAGNIINDAFGMHGTTAEKTREALGAARKATNRVNYTAARAGAGPVNLTPAIDNIDILTKRNPILGETGLADTEIGRRLARLRKQMTDSNSQLIDFDQVLNIKEDLGKVIARIQKSGETVPFEISTVYGSLDDALEVSSGGYRAANTAALAGRKVEGAVDKGAAMTSNLTRDADNIPKFNAMTPEEQAAARVGYGNKLLARGASNKAPTANKLADFNSSKVGNESAAMATDPNLLKSRLARENAMWKTQDTILGGSRTADNQMDIRNLGPIAEIGRAITSQNPIPATAIAATRALGPALTGQNPATRALIAQMLMSGDPSAFLNQAVRSKAVSDTTKRAVEALFRNSGRELSAQ